MKVVISEVGIAVFTLQMRKWAQRDCVACPRSPTPDRSTSRSVTFHCWASVGFKLTWGWGRGHEKTEYSSRPYNMHQTLKIVEEVFQSKRESFVDGVCV